MTRSLPHLLFSPRSIVVHGASSDPEKLSGRPLAYLKSMGFEGSLYAVNPRRDMVQGVRAYAAVGDIETQVDLAIVVVPAPAVPAALEECASAGVGAAIVFASGFSEAAVGVGVAEQERIAEIARTTGLRVVGPNCLGTFALPSKAFATFSTAFDTPGALPESPIALVTQSGAVGTFVYSMMIGRGVGVRYFANPGNQVDVSVIEVLDALVERNDVDVLMGHLEDFTDVEGFERLACRAREAGKPLVLLKAGSTSAGERAVGAHTGSRPGDDAVFERIAAEHGAIRAESMVQAVDLATALVAGRSTAGRRLTVVTQSGGAGALTADEAVGLGLDMSPWSDDLQADLAGDLPYFASTANPLDLTGAMINDTALFDRALSLACETDQTDAILVVLGNSDSVAEELVEICVTRHASTTKPFLVAWSGGSGRPRIDLLAAGVPAYEDPINAVRVMARLMGRQSVDERA